MANILIADSDPGIRQMISDTLRDFGHQLLFAEDGIKATELFEKNPIHVVLADNDLPGKDVIQFLQEIKKIRPQTAVIIMTGMGEDDSEEILDAGAFATLSKPFNVQDFKRIVTEAIPQSLVSLAALAPAERKVKEDQKVSKIKRKLGGGLFALAFFSLTSGGYFWYFKVRTEPIRIYSLPTSHISGIAFDNQSLWTCDWFNQTFHQHNLDAILSLKQSLPLSPAFPSSHPHPNPLPKGEGERVRGEGIKERKEYVPTGIAWDGKNFWSVSSWKKKVVRHGDSIQNFEIIIESPVTDPSALYFDGEFFWFCDAHEGKIVKTLFDGQMLKVLEKANSPGQKPVGIYKDKKFLWTADNRSGLIYKHEPQKNFKVIAVYALPDEIQNEKISCFTSDGKNFWIGSEISQKIYQIHPKQLKLVSKTD